MLSDTIVCRLIIIKELDMGANPADVVVDKTLIEEVKGMIKELVWNAKPSPTSTMVIKKGMKKPNLNKILED